MVVANFFQKFGRSGSKVKGQRNRNGIGHIYINDFRYENV